MNLTLVQLENKGAVSEDNGHSVWHSMGVAFGWGEAAIIADIHVDCYSGKTVAQVYRDDMRLPSEQVERLAIAVYRQCSRHMYVADADFGEAVCDIEPLAYRLLRRGQATALLRECRAAVAAAARHSPQLNSKKRKDGANDARQIR